LPSPLPNEWGVEPCLDLINSRWSDHLGTGAFHDRLTSPIWRRAFLKRWGFRVADPDDAAALVRLSKLRTALRNALELYIAGGRLSRGVRAGLEAEINRPRWQWKIEGRPGGEALTLDRDGDQWDMVAADLAISAVRLIGDGRVVKVCANPSCTWMFVDESRPGSRRWCDASICGSLINVRRHRRSARRDGVASQ
jgi:predicted RNA-binding Zn ribbon-like protein